MCYTGYNPTNGASHGREYDDDDPGGADLKEKLGRLSRSTRRTRPYFAVEAVEADVNRELQIEGIRRGLTDMEADRVTSHDDVTAEADRIIAEARSEDMLPFLDKAKREAPPKGDEI